MTSDLLDAIGSILSAVVAAIAAGVAFVAWKAAKNSAMATDALSRTEERRWHSESRPQFEARANFTTRHCVIVVWLNLAGPSVLQRLDRVEVSASIMNTPHGGLAEPYEPVDLNLPGNGLLHQNDSEVRVGDSIKFYIQIQAEHLYILEDEIHPLRLSLKCWSANHEPWIVPIRINKVAPPPRDRYPNEVRRDSMLTRLHSHSSWKPGSWRSLRVWRNDNRK